MNQPMYQVDAFTDHLFGGNPAAVCPLERWLPNAVMQQIATENNLSETAFFVRSGNGYDLRWFTPAVEVNLCGHATLATAHVLFNHLGHQGDTITFNSKSGLLKVSQEGNVLTLNFPVSEVQAFDTPPEGLLKALSVAHATVWRAGEDVMVVVDSQEQIEALKPDYRALAAVKARGIIVTAPGQEADFVSRFFAPQSGIDEDPCTGSAHTALTPYWANKLGKTTLHAVQLSARRGYLTCVSTGQRVLLSGKAVTYLIGQLTLPQF